MSRFSREIREKTLSETVFCSVDFSGYLASGETISGTPTVTPSSSKLTCTSVSANTSGTIVINNTTVAANKAVTWLAAAGTTDVTYIQEVRIQTTSSQVRYFGARLKVIADPTT